MCRRDALEEKEIHWHTLKQISNLLHECGLFPINDLIIEIPLKLKLKEKNTVKGRTSWEFDDL